MPGGSTPAGGGHRRIGWLRSLSRLRLGCFPPCRSSAPWFTGSRCSIWSPFIWQVRGRTDCSLLSVSPYNRLKRNRLTAQTDNAAGSLTAERVSLTCHSRCVISTWFLFFGSRHGSQSSCKEQGRDRAPEELLRGGNEGDVDYPCRRMVREAGSRMQCLVIARQRLESNG